jgi:hypothetical protein
MPLLAPRSCTVVEPPVKLRLTEQVQRAIASYVERGWRRTHIINVLQQHGYEIFGHMYSAMDYTKMFPHQVNQVRIWPEIRFEQQPQQEIPARQRMTHHKFRIDIAALQQGLRR